MGDDEESVSTAGEPTSTGALRRSSSSSALPVDHESKLTAQQLDQLEEEVVSKKRSRRRRSSGEATASTAKSSPEQQEQLSQLEEELVAKKREKLAANTRRSTSFVTKEAEQLLHKLEGRLSRRSSSPSPQCVDGALELLDDQSDKKPDEESDSHSIESSIDLEKDLQDLEDDRPTTPQSSPTRLDADRGIANEPDLLESSYDEEENLAVAIAINEDDVDDEGLIPSAMEYDPNAKPAFYKHRRFRLYGLFGCSLVLVMIVSVSVVVPLRKNLNNSSPTPAPTTFRETIQEQLVAIVGEEKLNDRSTPHYKAADWIMYQDPQQLMPDSYNLIQRYLLTLFYFSTTELGPWLSCNPPSGDEDAKCEFKELLQVAPEAAYGTKSWFRWLADVPECNWAGVMCDENGFVGAIELAGQDLSGTLPGELGELIYIQSISLFWNNFVGPLPAVWASNKHLLNVELNFNFLTGTIPNEWFEANALQRINVGGNMLTGTLSPKIGNLGALKGFFPMENLMSGTIPSELASLKFLSYTRLSRNEFTGTIPTEFGRLQRLQELWLHRNLLKGTIPTELGLLREVLDLRLHFNPLTGSIPEELYNLGELARLDLFDCELTGTISSSISKMSNLEAFKIRGNRGITGTIPSEIGLLPNIFEIWVHITGLVGTMPDEICEIRGVGFLEFLEANCAETNGFEPPALECTCCTTCCDAAAETCTGGGSASSEGNRSF